VGLKAEMVGQLDLHRALHRPLGQLGEQTSRPGDLLLGAGSGQQLIDHLIPDPLAVAPLDHLGQCGEVHGGINPTATRPSALANSGRGRRRLA